MKFGKSINVEECRKHVKELKEDFGDQGFCMDDFCATETAMRFVMIP